MKKLFLACLMVICFSTWAFAGPYLVCDPQTNVAEYRVVVDGSGDIVTAHDLGDGTVMLRFDCTGLTEGAHNFEVYSVNIWGESSPTPFDCVKALPSSPGGVGLSAE